MDAVIITDQISLNMTVIIVFIIIWTIPKNAYKKNEQIVNLKKN